MSADANRHILPAPWGHVVAWERDGAWVRAKLSEGPVPGAAETPAGGVAAFSLPPGTTFQRSVWAALVAIPAGETRTYAEVAAAVGRPRAARAVAAACAANPCPGIIPCHRVVAAAGLGGFSAPGGTDQKARMLASEAAR